MPVANGHLADRAQDSPPFLFLNSVACRLESFPGQDGDGKESKLFKIPAHSGLAQTISGAYPCRPVFEFFGVSNAFSVLLCSSGNGHAWPFLDKQPRGPLWIGLHLLPKRL